MNKYILVIFLFIGLVACTTKDKDYYRAHPTALQNALKYCPQQVPVGMSCQEAQALGVALNRLAYQLQSNPQAFGAEILHLQQLVAQEQPALLNNPQDTVLQTTLDQNKARLADLLTVVKWLESPEG